MFMELLNIDVLGCSKAETGCPRSEMSDSSLTYLLVVFMDA